MFCVASYIYIDKASLVANNLKLPAFVKKNLKPPYFLFPAARITRCQTKQPTSEWKRKQETEQNETS